MGKTANGNTNSVKTKNVKTKNARAVILPTKIIPLAALVPNERNYNAHPDSQIEILRESLREYGQVKEIAVKPIGNGKYEIEAGHGLVTAARLEGWTELKAAIIPRTWSRVKTLSYLHADNAIAKYSDPDEAQLRANVLWIHAENKALARLAAGEQNALDALLAQQEIPNVTFKEYDESAADDVQYVECPKCGHKFPK